MSAAPASKAPARERLLAAADELFYAEGVHTVGIDRVIERAGVAKASLYNTFGSKDELVRVYLQSRHVAVQERVGRHLARYTDPRDRLLSIFEAQGELLAQTGYRGCAFSSAVAESPGEGVLGAVRDYRQWVRGLITDLARAAGAPEPGRLARELHLVWDGAQQEFRVDRDPGVAQVARETAARLLDAALASAAR
jgi:AcrR family transcriptional regulator